MAANYFNYMQRKGWNDAVVNMMDLAMGDMEHEIVQHQYSDTQNDATDYESVNSQEEQNHYFQQLPHQSSPKRQRKNEDTNPLQTTTEAQNGPVLSETRQKYNKASQEYREATRHLAELEEQIKMAKEIKQEKRKTLEDLADQVMDDLLMEENDEWNQMYRILLLFKENRGHVRVSRVKNTKEDLAREPYLDRLGLWVYQQRADYRRGRDNPHDPGIEPYREKALTPLGFNWDLREEKWEMRFDQLKEFKAKHGHCDVPTSGKKYDADPHLQRWVNFQRKEYRKYKAGDLNNCLNEVRIQKLRDLGFQIEGVKEVTWYQQYEKLKDFYNVYGHCELKAVFGTQKLVEWLDRQQDYFNKNKLSQDRVLKLKQLDIDLSNDQSEEKRKERNWWMKYEAMRAHKLLYKTCQVSPNDRNRHELLEWSNEMRKEHQKFLKKESSVLNQDKIKRLDELRFQWDESNMDEEDAEHLLINCNEIVTGLSADMLQSTKVTNNKVSVVEGYASSISSLSSIRQLSTKCTYQHEVRNDQTTSCPGSRQAYI